MSQERQEKATPKKREDAKKKGQFARGMELPTALTFFAALIAANNKLIFALAIGFVFLLGGIFQVFVPIWQ